MENGIEVRTGAEIKSSEEATSKLANYSNSELVDKYMTTLPISLTKKELIDGADSQSLSIIFKIFTSDMLILKADINLLTPDFLIKSFPLIS